MRKVVGFRPSTSMLCPANFDNVDYDDDDYDGEENALLSERKGNESDLIAKKVRRHI